MFAYCILPLIESPSRAHGCLCCRAAGQAVPWLARGPRRVLRHLGAGPQRTAVRALALHLSAHPCLFRPGSRPLRCTGLHHRRGLRGCCLAWPTALVTTLCGLVRLPRLSLVAALALHLSAHPCLFRPGSRPLRRAGLHDWQGLRGCCLAWPTALVTTLCGLVRLPRLSVVAALALHFSAHPCLYRLGSGSFGARPVCSARASVLLSGLGNRAGKHSPQPCPSAWALSRSRYIIA